jgi:transposase
MVRCYRYCLNPSATQIAAIHRAAKAARAYWNGLVAVQRWAEREIKAGRQGSVVAEYEELLQGKALTGRAVSFARARAASDGVPVEDAISSLRSEKAAELGTIVRRKDGTRNRWLSRRRLAVEYACERIERTRKLKVSRLPAAVAYAMLQKFQAATAEYISGKRKRPRFKSFGDAISLQAQVTATTPWPLASGGHGETFVDLARIAGKVCGKVPVVFHRDLPAGAKIKQLALTTRGERMFAVLMIEALDAVLERQFPDAGGRVAGIDPGRKVALSLSTPDGNETAVIQPALAKDKWFLRRLRRGQRKADRQRRAGNPGCFDAGGRPIKGKRLSPPSQNLQATQRRIFEMQRHMADARLDFYHRSANYLLERFDAIGVGKWRGRGKAPGEGKARRAQNRKDYDHAISLFAGILRYKGGSKKQTFDVAEHGSTRDCDGCGEPTGPRGLQGLKIRKWVCSNCGAVHENRDFTAARAIARRTAEKLAAEAHSPCSQPARKGGEMQRRRSAGAGQTKVAPPEGAGVPVVDEAQAARPVARKLTPSAASAAVPGQFQGGARASLGAVAPGDSNIILAWSRQATGPKVRGPLAECAVDDSS